jgi:hypothetical protein
MIRSGLAHDGPPRLQTYTTRVLCPPGFAAAPGRDVRGAAAGISRPRVRRHGRQGRLGWRRTVAWCTLWVNCDARAVPAPASIRQRSLPTRRHRRLAVPCCGRSWNRRGASGRTTRATPPETRQHLVRAGFVFASEEQLGFSAASGLFRGLADRIVTTALPGVGYDPYRWMMPPRTCEDAMNEYDGG